MVIGSNLNLFLNSKKMYTGLRNYLAATCSQFLKITLSHSIPGKSSIYPTERAGTPTKSIWLPADTYWKH